MKDVKVSSTGITVAAAVLSGRIYDAAASDDGGCN